MNTDSVAVIHLILDDHFNLHASVPYISTLKNTHYPYSTTEITKNYKDDIKNDVEDLFRSQYSNETTQSITANKEYLSFYNNSSSKVKNNERCDKWKLYNLANKITRKFDLDILFDFIFSLKNEGIDLLQIVTNEPNIPWDWICDTSSGKLLCEVFGTGVIHPTSINPGRLKNYPISTIDLHVSSQSALIIGNTYATQNDKRLLNMSSEIKSISGKVSCAFGNDYTFTYHDQDRDQLKNILQNNICNTKLIYLAGHFDKRGFCTEDENGHLTAETINNLLNDCPHKSFPFAPIIILNGCSTKHSCENLVSITDPLQNLAKTFLAGGASACITTTTEIRFEHAMRFANVFFDKFLNPGTSVGMALLDTRMELKKQDCYEWASYSLMGDPTYTLIKSESLE